MAKVLVLYYSSYGHIERMALAEADGARGAGGDDGRPLTAQHRTIGFRDRRQADAGWRQVQIRPGPVRISSATQFRMR